MTLSEPVGGMRRRDFITLVGGAAAVWPRAAPAQEAGRIYRLGLLSSAPRGASSPAAFFDELRGLGFVEGQNLQMPVVSVLATISFPRVLSLLTATFLLFLRTPCGTIERRARRRCTRVPQAEECRQQAAKAISPLDTETLLRVAEEWIRLAQSTEERRG
jgi:hypothetical protein